MNNTTVTVELGPQWVAHLEWPEGETQGGPVRLVIEPADPDTYPAGGLSQTVLRDVPFREALTALREQTGGNRWDRMRTANRKKMDKLLLAYAEEGAVTDEYLALLSRAYVAAVSQGQDKPLDYLAELTGKSHAAIKQHLWKSTRKGLLERSPGRAGGTVTAKAANIIHTLTG